MFLLNLLLTMILVYAVVCPGVLASEGFVIENVRVFDGSKTLEGQDLIVRGGRIARLGKKLEHPAGLKIIDGTNCTVLPGLIDAHTHAHSNKDLMQALIFGVTTELDMFADVNFVRDIKEKQAAGKYQNMSKLCSAGILATAPGGHGTEYGFKIPTLTKPEEADAWVKARVSEGSDYIKIVYDDYSSYGTERPTLSKETLKAVIDAAHKYGKMAIVHIGSQEQAKEAIRDGADGLAHLFGDCAPSADFAELLAVHHAFAVPTLTVLEGFDGVASGASLCDDRRLLPYLDKESIANLKMKFPPMPKPNNEKFAEQTVDQLAKAHVPILAGTDADNPGTAHGVSIHRELELLVRSGLSPATALASATSVPAGIFKLNDRGRIAENLCADLIMVQGDPTKDIFATRDIVSVWKDGVLLDRDSYKNTLAKKAEELAKLLATPPEGSESGLVSDFEDGTMRTKFGAGWSISTDSIRGGKSAASTKIVDDGAEASKKSLRIAGKLSPAYEFPWAGALFSPGPKPFVPVNLSSKKTLKFWTKGDGKTYTVMLFTDGAEMPAEQSFKTSADWQQVSLPLSSFNGTDGHNIEAIIFASQSNTGDFEFQIDSVQLDK